MQTCIKCGEQKDGGDFELRKDSGKLRGTCKVCVCADGRARYHVKAGDPEFRKNKNKKSRVVQAMLRKPKQDYVNKIKEATPCADCGRYFPAICMDFDHRPGETKIEAVSRLAGAGKATLDRIKLELEKCDIVCACCHRVRTQSRKDYNKPIEN